MLGRTSLAGAVGTREGDVAGVSGIGLKVDSLGGGAICVFVVGGGGEPGGEESGEYPYGGGSR